MSDEQEIEERRDRVGYDPCGECLLGTCDQCPGCRWIVEMGERREMAVE